MANIDSSNFINNSILSYVLFYWSPNAVRSIFFSCSSEAERFLLRLIRNHIVKWTSNFDVLTFAWFEFDAKWQMNALATYLQAQSVYLWSTVHIRPACARQKCRFIVNTSLFNNQQQKQSIIFQEPPTKLTWLLSLYLMKFIKTCIYSIFCWYHRVSHWRRSRSLICLHHFTTNTAHTEQFHLLWLLFAHICVVNWPTN